MANFSLMNSTAIGGGIAQRGISATYQSQSLIAVSSNTTATQGAGAYRRVKIYDILVGTNGVPADNEIEFDFVRATITATAGAFTAFISSLSSNFTLDPADVNLICGLSINSSAEGGISPVTETWYFGLNQRASYRWVCAPGSELVLPAVSSNSLNGRARSLAYTGTVTMDVLANEQ